MSPVTRRLALQGVALSSASLMGCGGDSTESTDLASAAESESTSRALGLYIPRTAVAPITVPAPAPAPTPTPAPAPTPIATQPTGTAFPAGKYRINQPYLFQSVSAKVIPNRMPGGSSFLWDIFGPTNKYVDYQAGWLWSKPGGDWIDSKLTRYGTSPWFSAPVMGAAGSTAVKAYKADVTKLVSYCQTNKRWCAFLLVAKNAARTIAGKFDTKNAAPLLEVTYSDGQKVFLACRLVSTTSASSEGPNSTSAQYALPVFIEFERPTAAVKSAVMSFVVTAHWSGNNATIDGYLLDPPINAEPLKSGVAAQAGALDESLSQRPGILGVHRYLDGKPQTDFIYPEKLNFNAERNFDPAIYERGAQDKTKLPHVGLGKWITDDNIKVIPSSYTGEGFKPLAPGLGALRAKMFAKPGVVDGSITDSSGTLAANGMIYLPEHLFGKLDHLFVRYYFRLSGAYKATAANRKQVYQAPMTPPVWTTYAGKFGIAPDHSSSLGGVSGSSGGGNGWQMRHSWYDCDAGTNGPDEGGWSVGYHLYDFNYQNPKGYNYGGPDGKAPEERWGQRGGMGGVFYADHWYCVETEIKLNTVMMNAPGFVPDGVLRTWVDGRLVYERVGMVFRSLPRVSSPYNPDKMRPCRDLGIKGIWLDWFHGGKTVATFDRTSFYTGLAWGTQYIGPMKM